MVAQVENAVRHSVLRDSSDKFYSGMKREDVAKIKQGIFESNPYNEFNKIDTDGNGELSDSEIMGELENKYKELNANIKVASLGGILLTLMSMSKNISPGVRKFTFGVICYDLYTAIDSKNKMKKISNKTQEYYNTPLPDVKPEQENAGFVADSVQQTTDTVPKTQETPEEVVQKD